MYRASPPRTVAAFAKAAVAAAEVLDTDFAVTDFVNLERSTVTHSGGFATPEYALVPEKAQYDRIRFMFGKPTMGNADNTCTLELWVVGSDSANPYLAGQSELGADGLFPAIEIENFQGRYYIAVGAIDGTDAEVTVAVSVQGTYQGYIA